MAMTAVGRMAFGNLIEAKPDNFGNTRWGCGLILSDADVAPLQKFEQLAIERRKEFDKKFVAQSSPIVPSEKKNEDGTKEAVPGEWLVRFSRKLERKAKDGTLYRQDPPQLWDSLGRLVNGKIKEVPWGSMVAVRFEYYAYNRGSMGVNFDLVGAQISELAVTEDAPPPIEGGWVVEDDMDPSSELLAQA